MAMATRGKRPSFEQLPLHPDDPPFSAWGLYGPEDNLGTLNMIVPETVVEAAKEIKTGVRIGLDLPMDFLARPSHNRLRLTHTLVRKDPRLVHDDCVSFNTQISTQWDGFRHYGYQKERIFYGGVKTEEISGPGISNETGERAWYQGPSMTPRLGIHHWCRQGIMGRGVLLDYLRWAQANGKGYDLMGDHAISVDDLQACADAENVELRIGDILFVRSGWTVGYTALTEDEKVRYSYAEPTVLVGLETSVKTAKWLWDGSFSACGGDSPGWEKWPALPGEGEVGGIGKYRLHEVLLNGWGMPIAEMLDLEDLSKECERLNRWSFFFGSMPNNIVGGVASPCNAFAVM
ncbi:hypothetical protein HBH70_026490 [Parastagonospora nodorum]|nr:hypothetical protein HBH46_194610 [Parastagonospora nodorum]KAH4111631.1 hypothetical protein HBH47_239560 [Parastagonospora nodorum]KAH5148438.1 hypothetical protein HBH70_026490 [Parastagonospora nodorum]KAH5168129.1 hypothetical protein HBH77_239860 [Parastagonospora nodorum]KAH5210398.1 hypothetical protein HBH68_075710 [Parastagonospora nodorum]